MSRRWESALDTPSVRDTALLAEVLRSLQGQLEPATEAEAAALDAEVADLVSHAVAELQKVSGRAPVGAIAPVLGAGVLQEILRRRREGAPVDPALPHKVDTRR